MSFTNMLAANMTQEWQEGVVKAVLSGDTVVIRGRPMQGPPPERTLCLANVVAPKLASRPRRGESDDRKDEPFAWQSREALRKMIIGKPVQYIVDYDVPTIGREFGRIQFKGEDVITRLVTEGFLRTRLSSGQQRTPEFEQLVAAEQQAEGAGRGMWTKDALALKQAVREPVWEVADMKALVDPKKLYPAVVESVRDGSTLRMFLLPEMRYVTVSLAGIKCPGYRKGEDGRDVPEPYADEARFYTEARMLNREVRVALQAVTNNVFLGTVHHPRGNIAELLLKEGMARVVDWSLSVMADGRDQYRAAEAVAKQKRLRVFREYVAPNAAVQGEKQYVAKCVEIVNVETIVVKKADGAYQKLTLASVRQPRARDGEERPKSYYDIPWMYEAREFLRRKLVGHKVNVAIDYVKPASDGYPEKLCATVTIDGVNVAEALVSKGYATVVKYKPGDEMRSSQYDALYSAEQRAIEAKKGVHKDPADWPVMRVNDTTTNKELAKQFLPFLQRHQRLEAVCDHVVHGGRVKLFVPKQNAVIMVVLAGVQVPRTPRQGEQPEPGAAEALQFTRERCLQRTVEVSVDTMDKMGSYVGTIWADHQNLALGLVEHGLASAHFTAERLPYGHELFAAEKQAQARRIGMWANWVEPKEETETEAEERAVKYKEVLVTEVSDPAHVWVQPYDKVPEIEALGERLNAQLDSHTPGSHTAKVGDMCGAKFSDDGLWYRAKVTAIKGDKATVDFVDYGNSEEVAMGDLAPLPADCAGTQPVAYDVRLACIKIPDDADWLEEATVFLREGIVNKKFLLNEEYPGFVTLTDPDNNADVGRTMLAAGYVTVERRREKRLRTLVKDYMDSQEIARTNRRNMWEYGEVATNEDEAPEFGYRAPGDKRGKK